MLPKGRSFSDGERALAIALLATALFGAVVATIAVMRFDRGAVIGRPLSPYEIWIVASGAIGAAAGLYLWRHRIGHLGPRGAVRSLGGMVLVSVLGAVIAGTLALPLYGTMFGPFTLVVILASSPFAAMAWFVNQLAAHLLVQRFHAERDSIFAPNPPAPLPGLARRMPLSPRP